MRPKTEKDCRKKFQPAHCTVSVLWSKYSRWNAECSKLKIKIEYKKEIIKFYFTKMYSVQHYCPLK